MCVHPTEYTQALHQMFEQQGGIALVVIPAKQGLSRNLITCLQRSFCAYRERCLFVITGIEDVCLDKQKALFSELEVQLKAVLKIASPMIYVCPHAQVSACNLDELEVNQQVHRLRQGLLQQMETARLRRIENQLNQLSEYVIRILVAHLNSEVAGYVKRETAIQHELIKNIQRFTKRQLQKCDEHLQDGSDVAQALMLEAIEQLRQEALEEIQQTVFVKPNLVELKDVEQDYSELSNRYGRRVQKLLLEASKNLVSAAVLGGMRVQSNFIEHYQRLQAIEPKICIPVLPTNTSLSLHNDDLQMIIQQNCATHHIEKVIDPFNNLLWGRSLFGRCGTQPTVEKIQQQQWQTFKVSIGRFFDQLEMHSMRLINSYQRALMAQIEEDLKGYQSAYEQMCYGLTIQQATMQERLQAWGEQLRQDIQRMQ
jgi:hypothetical protein